LSSLRLIPSAGRPLEVPPERSGVVVGRSGEADFTLEDGSVSRRHARLEWRGDAWFVVDLGSANGTFVDGQRVGESRLDAGQEVRFGSLSMRAEIGDPGGIDATLAIPGLTAVMPAYTGGKEPDIPTEVSEVDEGLLAPPPASPPPPPGSPRPPGAAATAPGGSSPVGQMPPPPAPAAPKGRNPILWVAAGCGGCLVVFLGSIAVFFGSIWMATQGPVDDTRAQLQRIAAGDLEAAYAELAEAYRAQDSRESFAAFVAAHPCHTDFAEATFTSRSVQDETATLEGTLSTSSGDTEAVRILLANERGQWRISGIGFDPEPREE
jgi:predicted component of type VI protein secretion system